MSTTAWEILTCLALMLLYGGGGYLFGISLNRAYDNFEKKENDDGNHKS